MGGPADQLTSTGGVENQASTKNRTSSPAPRKFVDTSTGGSDTRVNKTEAKTDPKEPAAGSSKAQGTQVTQQRLDTVRMFCLMLGLAIVLGVGVHVFFGIPALTKVGVPFESALKKNCKTGGIVICCLVGSVAAAFFGRRVLDMRKEKAS